MRVAGHAYPWVWYAAGGGALCGGSITQAAGSQAVQEVSHKDSQSPRNQARYRNARVAKLVDARDLKSLSCEAMRVRPRPGHTLSRN